MSNSLKATIVLCLASLFWSGNFVIGRLASVENLVSHLVRILAGLRAKKKIIKIGNGNMKMAKMITNLLNLKYCSDFEIEFVNEQKTSIKTKNYNQRGKRDMQSAKYITQREGPRYVVLPLSRIG